MYLLTNYVTGMGEYFHSSENMSVTEKVLTWILIKNYYSINHLRHLDDFSKKGKCYNVRFNLK